MYLVTWQTRILDGPRTFLVIVLNGALRTSEKEVWESGNCELPDLKSVIWGWLIAVIELCEVPPWARGESSKSLPSVDVLELPPVEGRSLMLPNKPESPSFLRDRSDDEPHAYGSGGIGLSPHGKAPLNSFKHPIRQHNIINREQSRFLKFSLYSGNTQVVRMTLDYKDYHFITEPKLLRIKVNMSTPYNSYGGEKAK